MAWTRRSDRHRSVDRPKALDKVVSYYVDQLGRYPSSVRVSFGNGVTAVYDLRVEQPKPVVWKCRRLR